MPYIRKINRQKFDNSIDSLVKNLLEDTENDVLCGELNYVISRLIVELINKNNGGIKNYARLNTIIGALECSKQEFYRRIIGSYENEKILENGDIL